MRKGIFAAAVLLLSLGFCSRQLLAQQLLWDVDFKFGFDNREYASIDTEPSGTIFGAVLSPKVGLGFGEGHALYAGVDAAKYFGRTAPIIRRHSSMTATSSTPI